MGRKRKYHTEKERREAQRKWQMEHYQRNKDEIKNKSLEIYNLLKENGIDVLWDDRDKRPGVKFTDMEVIGIPITVIIGDRTLEKNEIEIKRRVDEQPELVAHQDLIASIGLR